MSTENSTELREDLKAQIIQHLNLEGRTVASISDDMPLFEEGLGLDSIDVLELIVLLDKNYGVRIADPKNGRDIFQSVASIAAHIEANR